MYNNCTFHIQGHTPGNFIEGPKNLPGFPLNRLPNGIPYTHTGNLLPTNPYQPSQHFSQPLNNIAKTPTNKYHENPYRKSPYRQTPPNQDAPNQDSQSLFPPIPRDWVNMFDGEVSSTTSTQQTTMQDSIARLIPNNIIRVPNAPSRGTSTVEDMWGDIKDDNLARIDISIQRSISLRKITANRIEANRQHALAI